MSACFPFSGVGGSVRFDLHPHCIREIPDQLSGRNSAEMAKKWNSTSGNREKRFGRLQHLKLLRKGVQPVRCGHCAVL